MLTDIRCPDCHKLLIRASAVGVVEAYCPKCKRPVTVAAAGLHWAIVPPEPALTPLIEAAGYTVPH